MGQFDLDTMQGLNRNFPKTVPVTVDDLQTEHLYILLEKYPLFNPCIVMVAECICENLDKSNNFISSG